MKIEILGTGCQKCEKVFEATKKAVGSMGIIAQIEKVEDMEKILEYGVMSTPALVVNGDVKIAGKVLSEDEIIKILNS